MGPVQLIQGLFNILIFVLRFVGLVLSQIPGTKHILKHLPWHTDEDFEKIPDDEWKKNHVTLEQLKQELYSTPEYQERDRRSRLTLAERAIEDNHVITKKHFIQPSYVTFRAKLNGTRVV